MRAGQSPARFRGAYGTIQGYEAAQKIRKGQARWVGVGQTVRQHHVIAGLFQIAKIESARTESLTPTDLPGVGTFFVESGRTILPNGFAIDWVSARFPHDR